MARYLTETGWADDGAPEGMQLTETGQYVPSNYGLSEVGGLSGAAQTQAQTAASAAAALGPFSTWMHETDPAKQAQIIAQAKPGEIIGAYDYQHPLYMGADGKAHMDGPEGRVYGDGSPQTTIAASVPAVAATRTAWDQDQASQGAKFDTLSKLALAAIVTMGAATVAAGTAGIGPLANTGTAGAASGTAPGSWTSGYDLPMGQGAGLETAGTPLQYAANETGGTMTDVPIGSGDADAIAQGLDAVDPYPLTPEGNALPPVEPGTSPIPPATPTTYPNGTPTPPLPKPGGSEGQMDPYPLDESGKALPPVEPGTSPVPDPTQTYYPNGTPTSADPTNPDVGPSPTTTPTTPGAPTPSTTTSATDLAKNLLSSGKTLAEIIPLLNAIAGDPLGLNKGIDAANKAAADASTASAESQRQLAAIAADQWNYYKTNYRPVETSLITQAKDAGSQDEFARNRGAAAADVTNAFDTAKKTSANRMQSFGLNPASPAYQSGQQSADLAEGATKAGALTTADNTTRNLAWAKQFDVANLGRNIPSQSAAATGAAGNLANQSGQLANQSSVIANNQSIANTRAMGYGLNALGDAASKWFGTGVAQPPTYGTGGYTGSQWSEGMAEGGKVKRYYTPHMKHYAIGGGVGRAGLEPMDMSNMGEGATIDNGTGKVEGVGTSTSDSIPAQIDGQEPAALSDGEFVVNADAVELTGEEILEAINEAGLKKRQGAGLQQKTSNDVPLNAGAQAYAKGGRVNRFACAGL